MNARLLAVEVRIEAMDQLLTLTSELCLVPATATGSWAKGVPSMGGLLALLGLVTGGGEEVCRGPGVALGPVRVAVTSHRVFRVSV